MATQITCGGSAVDSQDICQSPDAEASKKTPKESLDYGDFTLGTLSLSQIESYLHILKVPAPATADLESLNALIAAHLEQIPFQGIDTFLERQGSLEAGAVFSKVVEQGRGGNCFELNSLFARLLLSFGYHVEVRCARMRWAVPEDAPLAPVDHMVLCVSLDGKAGHGSEGRFLVDVGFGGPSPRRALPLDGDASPYRLSTVEEDWAKPIEVSMKYRRQREDEDYCWLPLYQVFAYSHEWPDFVDKSWYFPTYPGVVFRDVLAVSRYDGNCWLTLRNKKFTRRRCDSNELGEVVEQRFATNVEDILCFLDLELKVKLDPSLDKEKLFARVQQL
ncbi:arylamine N-acetyltransferase-like [Amblyomma americanum]